MSFATSSALNGVRVAARASRPAARRTAVVVRAEDNKIEKKTRPAGKLYFGGLGASESSLSYLDGTLPADYGFDPLGLMDPREAGGFITPSWLAYAEVIHCRWAMLGAAGCIAPEILGKAGLIPAETALPWYASGVIPPAGEFEYWTDPYTLFLSELVLMGFAETRRLQDYRKPGSQSKQFFLGLEAVFGGSGNPAYPGGQFFNMAGLGAKDEAEMKTLKAKEVKNGRLAMLAMLGYFVQAGVTHAGPYENLCAHLANPAGANILTNWSSVGGAL